MAKRRANNKSSSRNTNGTTTTTITVSKDNNINEPEKSAVGVCGFALKQKIRSSVCWTPDEQHLLEELLIKHASDSIIKRYATIVLKFQGKTLNDVALRHRWMIEKAACQQVKPSSRATYHSNGLHYARLSTPQDGDECIDEVCGCTTTGCKVSANDSAFKEKGNGRKRKYDSNSSRRHKIKSEKAAYQQVNPSSHATNHSNGLHCAKLSASIDNHEDIDDEISYKAIGGAAAQLLEQNEQAFNQFYANISAFKLHENIALGSQMRNNIDALLYESLYNMPDMKLSARQLYDFPVVSRLKRV